MYDLSTIGTRIPFWYSATINWDDAAVVGSQSQTAFTLKATTFVCLRIIVVSRIDDTGILVDGTDVDSAGGGGSVIDPGVLWSFSHTGADRTHMNTSLDGYVMAPGSGRNPGALPAPLLLRASSTVNITAILQRQVAAGTGMDTRFIFEGVDDYNANL